MGFGIMKEAFAQLRGRDCFDKQTGSAPKPVRLLSRPTCFLCKFAKFAKFAKLPNEIEFFENLKICQICQMCSHLTNVLKSAKLCQEQAMMTAGR